MAIVKLDEDQKKYEENLIKQIESGNRTPSLLGVKIFDYVHKLNKETSDAKAHYIRLLKDNFPKSWINNSWRDQIEPAKPQQIRTKSETDEHIYKEHEEEKPEPESTPDEKPETRAEKRARKKEEKAAKKAAEENAPPSSPE